jgi:membrane-associated protease RseP (regulator of RpoE activity)
MMDVTHSMVTHPGRMAALVLALAPLGATTALAQRAVPDTVSRTVTRLCINDQCTEDSSRVVVVRLMRQADSLQRIYLGKPIAPAEREQVKTQLESMLQHIAELQSDQFVMWGRQAERADRDAARAAASAERAGAVWSVGVAPRDVSAAAPKGWIGITFVGASVEDVHDGEYFVRFLDYPEVESVEPSSPAQRAGITRGDLLLAFNGKDVTTQPISMTRLLQPEHKVVVRMKRDGTAHDYALTVAPAPRSYVLRLEDFAAPRPPAGVVVGSAPGAVAPLPAQGEFFPARPTPRAVGALTVRSGTFLPFDSEHAPVAGAQMSTLDAELARNLDLGVTQGVMVMSVPSGSPAQQAGLRGGDVVVTVAGDSVASVRELRHVLERHAGEATVELHVVRNHKTAVVKLNNE